MTADEVAAAIGDLASRQINVEMSEAERDAASTELLIQAKLELSDVDFEDIQRHLLVMHHAGVNAIVTAGGDGSWK